jgi:ADP-ribose pyrophosphatase
MKAEIHRRKKALINSSETVYKGKLFSFVTEDVTLPNQSRAEFAWVRHPGSTAIVPFLDDGSVVMTLQYRHAVREYLLEIPAGTLDPGETPLNCARRELEEETGYVAATLTQLAQVYILPAYSNEKIHIYLARGLKPTRQNLDKDEIIDVVTNTPDQLKEMINTGLITDALTVLSLQHAWEFLRDSED